MSDFIRTNTTEAGGSLTEEEFFAGMLSAMKYVPQPSGIVVSWSTVERARADALRLHGVARDSLMEYRRLRRWRFVRRHRALLRSAEAAQGALALDRTFGTV